MQYIFAFSDTATGRWGREREIGGNRVENHPAGSKPVRCANRGYGSLALGNHSAALADAETGISLNANYTTTY